MRRSVPQLDDYQISPTHGFLPHELPLESLSDPYYSKWESIVRNLQGLILSRRLRDVVDRLPVLSTARLASEAEWRRAYSILGFISHAYIWGGDGPAEVVPPSLSVPFLSTCDHFGLPPVATYAAVVLWNFKPLFDDEPFDSLENLSTLTTFTGSIDESWFYLVSVAIEARCAHIIPEMLDAIHAVRAGDTPVVMRHLQHLAETLETLSALLVRMYENCDPHVFYHRIRPFLAGSKNMADAGLPNGVIFDTDGTASAPHVQFSGGSNAQSSILQFFDIVLGIEHLPTGAKREESSDSEGAGPPPPSHNFIMEMRRYMPRAHREFLQHVSDVANIRDYVEQRRSNKGLCAAFDACLAMLRDFRDKHIQMVSRYIVVKSRESRSSNRSISPRQAPPPSFGLAKQRSDSNSQQRQRALRGTGGTALIQFLKQARDESGEPAIGSWARRLMTNSPAALGFGAALGSVEEHADGEVQITGLAGTWSVDDSEGGICHW
ncbi:MAG: hypothetical protein Q9162_002924 [Coniocarpon cinnabarinum]